MAFDYLQTFIIDEHLDNDEESDIEFGELSDNDDSAEQGENQTGSRSRPTTCESWSCSNSTPHLDVNQQEWSDVLTDFVDDLEPFSEFAGSLHNLPVDSEPLDYFSLFFPDSILQTIMEETNLYAEQQQAAKGTRDVYWKPATLTDIRKYIYTLITFGHHQVPEVSLIWSTDPYWRVSAIADVWGRQRYQKIHQYFHLSNSENQPWDNDNYDPLYKVRPLLDHIRNVCATVYKPEQNLTIDKTMVASGRVSFTQCIKNKPAPRGFRIWCLAEAETGYLLNFEVDTGKSTTKPEHGLGHQIVTTVMADHLGKNHSVHFGNFFSSMKLAEDLLKEKTTCCGTINPNRKGWPIPKACQRLGEVVMKQKGRMVAVHWTDERHGQVNVLSTNADPKMVVMKRETKHGVVQFQIPQPVLQFNSAMFGVELNNQYRSYYPVGRPGTKRWRYLFYYLIQISIVNAFVLMKRARPNDSRTSVSQNHLMFRTSLVKSLLNGTESTRRPPEVPTVLGSVRPHSQRHGLVRMPGRKRRCYQCSKDGVKMVSGRTRETVNGCPLCHVHLHRGDCYAKFHSHLKN